MWYRRDPNSSVSVRKLAPRANYPHVAPSRRILLGSPTDTMHPAASRSRYKPRGGPIPGGIKPANPYICNCFLLTHIQPLLRSPFWFTIGHRGAICITGRVTSSLPFAAFQPPRKARMQIRHAWLRGRPVWGTWTSGRGTGFLLLLYEKVQVGVN